MNNYVFFVNNIYFPHLTILQKNQMLFVLMVLVLLIKEHTHNLRYLVLKQWFWCFACYSLTEKGILKIVRAVFTGIVVNTFVCL